MTSVISNPALMPESISAVVNGATLVAPQLISEKGNAWYLAKFEVAIDPEASAAKLLDFTALFNGAELPMGASGIHDSLPKRSRTGAKKGQVIAGTGGDATVLYSGVRSFNDKEFLVSVGATRKVRKATATKDERTVLVVVLKAVPRPAPRESKPFETVGQLVGELSFG